MIVSVNGAKNRELTKLLKLAAQSFADRLLSPQLEKNIQVKIKIHDHLEAGGFFDFEEEGLPNHRSFKIYICRTKEDTYVLSTCT